MIRKIAVACAEQWAKSGVIDKADIESYQYGMELAISTLLNLSIMIIVSAALGHPLLFIPYLVAFIPLRLSAGGYHAKHHLTCILFNALIYLVGITAVFELSVLTAKLSCIIGACISLAIAFLFAPIQARNKPLSPIEIRRNRNISICLEVILLVLCMLFYYTNLLEISWCKMLYCGQAAATMLLIMEKLASIKSIKNL
jgi:accessory gene regulator B